MNCPSPTLSSSAFSINPTLINLPPYRLRLHRLHSSASTLAPPSSSVRLGTCKKKCLLLVSCTAAQNSDGPDNDWKKRLPFRNFGPDNILRSIAGATSSPICQFISSPTTFLHSIDPRIKLVWLLTLIFLPARSHISMRFGIVFYLALLTICVLPRNVWMDQLGRVSLLSGILFITLALSTDGAPPVVSPRAKPSSLMGLPDMTKSYLGYNYMLLKLGPLQLTRKGLSVASTSACLTFIIFQSASLCLATTTPEQLASALRWFMLPLTHIGVPVAEIILTLLLSLRFINLVFDEVRNVALGILSRRISWKQLTFQETIMVFVMYIQRVFKNIFSHAEQISQAMIVRGFRGDSRTHKIHFLSDSKLRFQDITSLLALVGLASVALVSDIYLL